MPTSDPFALKNSGLGEFLFAEVGTEVNGSPLTILSVLARLGQDPWAEAARWTKLPKASIIDALANCISQMPLCPQALVEARTTAARLILLLPQRTQSFQQPERVTDSKVTFPKWWPVAAIMAVLALCIGLQLAPSAAPTGVHTPPIGQTLEHPDASRN
jgi:hypothetical protein